MYECMLPERRKDYVLLHLHSAQRSIPLWYLSLPSNVTNMAPTDDTDNAIPTWRLFPASGYVCIHKLDTATEDSLRAIGPLFRGRKQVLGEFSFCFCLCIELWPAGGADGPGVLMKMPAKKIHHRLVRCHYNGRVRYLPDQMSTQSTVQPVWSFFSDDCLQSLPEGPIFCTLFS